MSKEEEEGSHSREDNTKSKKGKKDVGNKTSAAVTRRYESQSRERNNFRSHCKVKNQATSKTWKRLIVTVRENLQQHNRVIIKNNVKDAW